MEKEMICMIVKMNGSDFYTVSSNIGSSSVKTVDGNDLVTLEDVWGSFSDWFNTLSDKVIYAEVDFFVKVVGGVIKGLFLGIVDLLNTYSVEIILGGVLWCGFSCMLAPLFGGRSGEWVGRTAFVLIFGSIWRIII